MINQMDSLSMKDINAELRDTENKILQAEHPELDISKLTRPERRRLLREAKKKEVTYTFTRAQLEEHDNFIRTQFKERCKADIIQKLDADIEARKKEIDDYLTEEWKRREEIFSGINEGGDGFFNILSLLLATSSKVLIEKFHWKPVPKDSYFDKRLATARFGDYLVEEINAILEDENADIRRYCDKVYEDYGVKFIMTEE